MHACNGCRRQPRLERLEEEGGEALLEEGDVLVRTTAKPGWAAAEGPRAVATGTSGRVNPVR